MNHLVNVLTVFSDRKFPQNNGGNVSGFKTELFASQDYYPFGMLMPGRDFSSENYRFGFNTQEKIEEISGTGNHNTALFWEYDTRLSRRWNIDPKIKPELSSYSCFSLSPLFRIDPLGDDDFFNTNGKFLYSTKTESRDIYITGYNAMRGMFGPLRIDFYKFNKENAGTLTNIAQYYAKEAGVNVENLHNKDFSVANREDVGLNLPNVKSLYNDGKALDDDMMNTVRVEKKITITLDDGHVNPLLSDGNNFVSSIGHEYDHILTGSQTVWEHLQIYYNQVSDPNFGKTTKGFQNRITRNVIRELNNVTNVRTGEYKDAINKAGQEWKVKFENKLKRKL